MRDRTITFMFIPQDSGRAKTVSIPGVIPAIAVFFLLALAASFAYIAVDYGAKRAEIARLRSSPELSVDSRPRQSEEIQQEIAKLEGEIRKLQKLERDLWELTNLEIQRREDSFTSVGVGGPSPSDQRILSRPPDASAKDSNSTLYDILQELERMQDEVVERRNSFYAFINHFEKTQAILASRPAIRPTRGVVVSGFGKRVSPFTGEEEFHGGVDIAGRYGAPVHATADGTVSYAGTLGTYGKLVTIRHDYGYETRYGHLSEIAVKRWQRVKRGDIIGYMGNTGQSTGTHLHYEVILGHDKLNPLTFFLD
ncbi:MAG: M23 family metallopeptidase [bacterium]